MQKFRRVKYWVPLICSAMFVGGIWLGVFLSTMERESHGEKKLREMLALVRENYVDEVDIDSLIEKSLPAILGNLDPHSAYIPAKDLEAASTSLKGSFGGVGIQFQIYRDTINVVETIAGGPSEKAGLHAGDRIVAVGKRNVTGTWLTEDSVRSILKGPAGSKVQLTVVRPGQADKTFRYTLTRGNIPVSSVDTYYMVDDKTGLVKINSFGEKTYGEFMQAMQSLVAQGASSFIVDLRGNTGGYMEPAILLANEFLQAGQTIVSTRGRNMEEEIVRSDGTGAFQDAPLAVLTDELTASSAEIFSGAIQDHDRGLIIGRRTFGKGLVQRPMEFDDGSEMRLTVQRYYTPSGRCIQKQYRPGENDDYELEIFERFRNGESMNADSVKLHKDLLFNTDGGRAVYGGGGIMPDIFVPNDTTGVTRYYMDVANKGLLMDFAYEYTDLNRSDLRKVRNASELETALPRDQVLLSSMVYYATTRGVPARWYYINQSSKLIVNQLKALIARNVLGLPAYYQLAYRDDSTIARALQEIRRGNAAPPVSGSSETGDNDRNSKKTAFVRRHQTRIS